ncbi:MAG: electron transfer flavoprotein subunit alpha/FixB family protein [Candidatus Lambdaproteobacteria bacterium]|nr:electron transfer flavoprotein subunit alpha/FixB family protein [Candidatus Lambdaproteobacteria bacterium]
MASATLRNEVWVWLPREREGALHHAAWELLHEGGTAARRLGAPLIALGDRLPAAEETARLAAWRVTAVRVLGTSLPPHPVLGAGRSPLAPFAGEGLPRLFLLAADAFGRALAPAWAAEHDAALATGATGVTLQGQEAVVARPVFDEQIELLERFPLARPLVVTLQPGAIGAGVPPPRAGGEPPSPAPPVAVADAAPPGRGDSADAVAAAILPPDRARLELADAERIVAFGRGAFGAQGLALVRRLAGLLGAVVAGTRPAADEGWLPFARQIGLTGAVVRPKLYVAVGLSGAPYHMAGVREPELLIAINHDPAAPIMGLAHLALVGDLFTLLPALIRRLEAGAALPAAAAGEARPPDGSDDGQRP